MMRKLIVSSFVSLDGVIEGPMRWASPFFDAELQAESSRELDDVDLFLMGRVSYDIFFPAWSGKHGDPYLDRINALPKAVASRSKRDLQWNAELIVGDVAAILAGMKAQPGGTILKYGISNLDRTLLGAGLVDEYHLSIVPVRVGAGKRAFDDVDAAAIKLDLIGTTRYGNGVVKLRYRPR